MGIGEDASGSSLLGSLWKYKRESKIISISTWTFKLWWLLHVNYLWSWCINCWYWHRFGCRKTSPVEKKKCFCKNIAWGLVLIQENSFSFSEMSQLWSIPESNAINKKKKKPLTTVGPSSPSKPLLFRAYGSLNAESSDNTWSKRQFIHILRHAWSF